MQRTGYRKTGRSCNRPGKLLLIRSHQFCFACSRGPTSGNKVLLSSRKCTFRFNCNTRAIYLFSSKLLTTNNKPTKQTDNSCAHQRHSGLSSHLLKHSSAVSRSSLMPPPPRMAGRSPPTHSVSCRVHPAPDRLRPAGRARPAPPVPLPRADGVQKHGHKPL